MATEADRHLLFGLIALQVGLIDQSQLVAAFQSWARDKTRSLADHLADRGGLDADGRAAVEAMAVLHLRKHDGDTQKSLASIPAGRSTRERLAALGDPVLTGTVTHLGSGPSEHDDDRTASYAVGTATSEGQRFRVLRPHARGGLGAVFVALDSELNREVALKRILDHHADDPTSRQRFLLEAEITGGLEHPGIVPVYGLGTYDGGRPYYAMRFIKGDSLKEAIERFHGDEALKADPGRWSLELHNLLRRFTDVCNAIDYAHGRGVLHRDIKPGNVIVGKHGETLVVDWGLAKPMGRIEPGSDPGERTLMPSSASGSAETLPGSVMGTPAYMSPEQAQGDLERLGPRSDVYSLGSTLYCLLTGRPPFEGEEIRDVLRKVQRGDFAPPRSLVPSIDRALEAVCLKAMAFPPDDRYATCRALAEDIERWTADEAVTAWHEPMAWRARRWGRRNRSVVTAGVGALLLVAMAAVTSAFAIQGARSRELKALAAARNALAAERAAKSEAQENFQTARKAVQDYLTSVSENTLLKQQGRTDLRALRKELLEGALRYYTGFIAGHANDPTLQAELADAYFRIGTITEEIGSKPEALRLMERSLEIRRQRADADPAATQPRRELANGLDRIGLLRRDTGDLAGASSSIERALAIRQELADADPSDAGLRRELAASHNNLANLERITGHPDEALRSFERALAIRQRLADASPSDAGDRRRLADTLHNAARLQDETGHPDEALRAEARAEAILEELAAADPSDTAARSSLAGSHMQTGAIHRATGRIDDAVRSYTRALEIQRDLADANPSVTEFRSNLARSYFNMGRAQSEVGRNDDALRSYDQALAIHRRLVGANPSVTAFRRDLAATHVNIGVIQGDTGHPTEALRSFEQALPIFRGLVEASPSVTEFRSNLALTLLNIGFMRRDLGRPDAALESFRECQQVYRELVDANPSVTGFRTGLANSLDNIGDLQRKSGQMAEALRSHERARELYQGLADANPSVTGFQTGLARSHNYIGIVHSATGRPAEALRSYERAMAVRQRLADANPATPWIHADLANSHSNIGYLHRDNNRPTEALRSFDRARAIYQGLAEANPAVPDFRNSLALCYINIGQIHRQAGRPGEALRSFEQARAIRETLPPTGPDSLYDGACLWSQISMLAGPGDPGRSAADRAMRLLREAVAAGYRDRANMEKDSDLDALRSRPDFRLLMLDLAFPADPFAGGG